MKVGSFFPVQTKSTLYAMGADDCSLFFDLEALTQNSSIDHLANIALTSALQVALIALGKPIDYVAMFEKFRDAPWAGLLQRYRRQFLAPAIPRSRREHVIHGRTSNSLPLDRRQGPRRRAGQPVHGQRHELGAAQEPRRAGGQP